MKPSFNEERKLWKAGVKFVIGIDEVGRGAFAGPIVAGAVIFPQILRLSRKYSTLKKVNDSKLLKAPLRRKLAKIIKKYSFVYAIAEVNVQTINKSGIGRANKTVFRKVMNRIIQQIEESIGRKLKKNEYFLLSDGFPINYIKGGKKTQKAIINGDRKSITIAAASIIAKLHRDSLMRNYAKKYHHYKFALNKGYGTKGHQKALKKYGLTDIHRTSFELTKFLSQ